MRTKVELTHTTASNIFRYLMNYQMLLDILTADKQLNPEDLKKFAQDLASKQHDIHLRRDTLMHAIMISEAKDDMYAMSEEEKQKFLKSKVTRSCS